MMNGKCKRCCGISSLVVGALVLANAFLWPKWVGVDGWVTFFGLLLLLSGFIKLVVPNKCPGCNAMACDMKPAGKGKK